MNIRIDSLIPGAKAATGTVIIVDVFRAFTTASIAFSRGAEKIFMVAEVEEALELRRKGLARICMGEVDGKKPPGFDHGNSPYEISRAGVQGLVIAQSTRAGTTGVAAATKADCVFAASLVNARATVLAVLKAKPDVVTIVAMGASGLVRSDEDEQCAMLLKNRLEGRTPDIEAVRRLVLAGAESQKYGDPARPHFHPKDRELALKIDSLDIAIGVRRDNGLLAAYPVTD
ncbi:MAG: 2-phosphosulfolactate phosphatase [SAR202 cluster bacterium]|nr:2-phosphosulfolactate phosphatase [SAR202 cluster bacterium]